MSSLMEKTVCGRNKGGQGSGGHEKDEAVTPRPADARLGPEPVSGRPLSWMRRHRGWDQASEDEHLAPERDRARAQRHLPPPCPELHRRPWPGGSLAQATAPSIPHFPTRPAVPPAP